MGSFEAAVESKGGKQWLVLRLEVNGEFTPSSTGKTLQVASTHGNLPTSVVLKGKPVVVGVNAYIRA